MSTLWSQWTGLKEKKKQKNKTDYLSALWTWPAASPSSAIDLKTNLVLGLHSQTLDQYISIFPLKIRERRISIKNFKVHPKLQIPALSAHPTPNISGASDCVDQTVTLQLVRHNPSLLEASQIVYKWRYLHQDGIFTVAAKLKG